MITDESLINIYTKNINSETITSKDLISYGLNYYDINKLITNGVIQRIKKGEYGLPTFESLYNYGVYLIQKEDYPRAFYIFLKCHQLDPNHLETCEYLFLLKIKIKDDKRSYELLEKILSLSPLENENINNIYLYLLSYTMQHHKKYNIKIKCLKLKDLLLPGRKPNAEYNKKADNLVDVLEVIGNYEENESLSQIQKTIIQELIKQSQNKEQKLHKQILKLARNEQYEKIITILGTRDKQTNLSLYYKNILILSQKILEIIKTGNIPNVQNEYSYNISSILQNVIFNNFKRALELKMQLSLFQNSTNDSENDIENILLKRINELTNPSESVQKINIISKEEMLNEDIKNISISLFENKYDKAIELIKNYLIKLDKEEYIYIIINLIKISIYDGDRSYSKPITILIELSNNEYEYNISFYIQDFYSSINENKLNSAQLYLNMIEKYNPESKEVINNLKNDLTIATQKNNEKKKEFRKILLEQLAEMKENNETIRILEEMTHSRRKLMYKVIKSIPELIGFSIGKEPKKLVLRYLNPNLRKEDPLKKLKLSREASSQKKYQLALKLSFQVLKNPSYNPYHRANAEIYAHIGCIYLQLKEIDKAIKYLTVATELNKEDPKAIKEYDFTNLLYQLENMNNISIEEFVDNNQLDKVSLSVEPLDDFISNIETKNIEDIAYYIKESKIKIKEAINKFNLSDEQIQLIKLIYARDYYIEGMYPQGDALLHEVEKSKDKTSKVVKLLNEIRTNKRFYKNRIHTHTRRRII